ncbi:hypothetical protein [Chitinophaga tropicalis]|uniref:Uncharacterized protein n=1 Tax=Chitinophaga tropicalis TaxID=2683588 RepID=A0A7K1U580_9BACT|nr:hypothetical protein [Chitinophaga tropicalis]MVT09517.1 hypothetical protein [Chitinophaga tropicalis]
MEPSPKELQEIKSILEQEHGREFTWEEAEKAFRAIQVLAEIALDAASEEIRRENLFEQSPKGFHLDKTGSCVICGNVTSGEDSWYDKHGLKCMACQAAVDKKIIPVSVIKNRENWYSKYDLEDYFNLKGAMLKKYIKQGLLKERIIPGAGKKIHLQLFLIIDNKETLPPKKLLKSRTVKVQHKGEEYYATENWYEFASPATLKKLSKYKIIHCLPETLAQPIETGRFLYKEINPLLGP